MYSQVAKIFENQEDLLAEFGQFLPESNHSAIETKPILQEPKKPLKPTPREYSAPPAATGRGHGGTGTNKRTSTAPTVHAITKKPKLSAPYKDVTLAEAARYGTLHDFSFFDRCRIMLKHPHVYDNFLRCLRIYNEEVISRQELLAMTTPFFTKNPEMFAWFKDFIRTRQSSAGDMPYEPVPPSVKQEKPEEQTLEIGEEYFSTCKRLGASYCALPKNHVPSHVSNRTALCKEVLNDVWVSFPTWSEDSTFVTSRKTQYEEYICRCEDERFEVGLKFYFFVSFCFLS